MEDMKMLRKMVISRFFAEYVIIDYNNIISLFMFDKSNRFINIRTIGQILPNEISSYLEYYISWTSFTFISF